MQNKIRFSWIDAVIVLFLAGALVFGAKSVGLLRGGEAGAEEITFMVEHTAVTDRVKDMLVNSVGKTVNISKNGVANAVIADVTFERQKLLGFDMEKGEYKRVYGTKKWDVVVVLSAKGKTGEDGGVIVGDTDIRVGEPLVVNTGIISPRGFVLQMEVAE